MKNIKRALFSFSYTIYRYHCSVSEADEIPPITVRTGTAIFYLPIESISVY